MSEQGKHTADTDDLILTILSLSSVEEAYAFFDDLCTINEFRSMAQRLQVAKLLVSGKTFNEVSESTGASSATISRVNRCLKYGEGYGTVLKKAKDGE